MAEHVSMDPSEIDRIVPTESFHYLYLKSGFVVQFNPNTGTIGRVARLPSMADVKAKFDAGPPKVQVGRVNL